VGTQTHRHAHTRTVLSMHSNTREGVLLSGSRTTSSSLMMLGPSDRFCLFEFNYLDSIGSVLVTECCITTNRRPLCSGGALLQLAPLPLNPKARMYLWVSISPAG
jgi:hypothetical protein